VRKSVFGRGLLCVLFGLPIFFALSVLQKDAVGERTLPTSLWGTEETYHPAEELFWFPKWLSVLARFEQEGFPPKARQLIVELRNMPPRERLTRAHRHVARALRYVPDTRNYGQNDYWASPVEFFLGEGGDCEDFAFTWYLMLRELSFSPASMRIVFLERTQYRDYHAVLVVHYGGKELVFDNRFAHLYETRHMHANETGIFRYRPIFSVSEKGWWRHVLLKETEKER